VVQSKADAKSMEGLTIALGGTAADSVEAKQTVLALGGQFTLSAEDTISVQIAKAQELKLGSTSVSKSGATLLAASFDHNLSKNTTMYVAVAKVNNDDGAQFSATGYAHGGVGTPGADASGKAASPTSLSLGMIRNF
jgi:predicted porin